MKRADRHDANKLVEALGLADVGIVNARQLFRNSSYRELFKKETDAHLDPQERGVVTEFGAVAVDTGRFTGRSPKDKYIVGGGVSSSHIWWAGAEHPGSGNQPLSLETWDLLHDVVTNELSGKTLYVMDGYSGASSKHQLSVRLVTEVAWQAHFFKNMFLRPSKEALVDFVPDWTILSAPKTSCPDFETHGLNSEVFIVINIEKRHVLIGGTWYGGEIKKAMFSVMNYLLPLKGVGSFHCSANMGKRGDTALFFGLSGTGKTTLSADPERLLIGDDEHGWDEDGIFNLEGGCYAKVIHLSALGEPDIYRAIKRDALLENVVVDKKGVVDFSSDRKTQNTRVSYPIYHIKNIVKPSLGGHPKTIIFLTCDAFGVLPPVALLNRQQAEYMFLSGYTARVAGTERGVDEPKATFSACFGAPFLLLHPTRYADILGKKIDQHGALVYLVNTGWIGGSYGAGQRIRLSDTRQIVSEVLRGALKKTTSEELPIFKLKIPTVVDGIDPQILNPRNAWADPEEYDQTARRVAHLFIDNFKTFTDTQSGKQLETAGPTL